MTTSSHCPSSFALLRLALHPDEADDQIEQHVSGCADCQRIVAEQQAQGDAYMTSPSADALRQRLQVLDGDVALRTRRTGPAALWAWGGALAAAASLALVFSMAGRDGILSGGQPVSRPDEPRSDGPMESLVPKGGAQLGLWVEEGSEASVQLGESAVLRPGQRVQPTFAAPKSGFVALLLTTPAGLVVPLYPAGGPSAPLQAGPTAPLGPSFRLDEEVGTYRVTAYFSESSFATKDLPVQHQRPEERSFVGVTSTRTFEVRR